MMAASRSLHGSQPPGSRPKLSRLLTPQREIDSSSTINYVETHGTGTRLGDPIEVEALSNAFAGLRNRTEPCALGSVKSNIGHLDAAAGIAGFVKTVLMLEHGEIPCFIARRAAQC